MRPMLLIRKAHAPPENLGILCPKYIVVEALSDADIGRPTFTKRLAWLGLEFHQ